MFISSWAICSFRLLLWGERKRPPALLQSELVAERERARELLLNTEQLVCPQQCNRIWERPLGHYHHHSVWPTKSAKAPSPTAVSAKPPLRAHGELLFGSDLPSSTARQSSWVEGIHCTVAVNTKQMIQYQYELFLGNAEPWHIKFFYLMAQIASLLT